jgi:replicative DNA helicase
MPDFTHCHSERGEQCVLGTLLMHPQAWNDVADIVTTPEMFYDRNRRLLAWVLIQRARNGEPIDMGSMQDALMQIPFADSVRGMDDGICVMTRAGIDPSDSLMLAIGFNGLADLGTHAARHRVKAAALALVEHYRQRQLAEELELALAKLTSVGGRGAAGEIGDRVVNRTSRILGGAYGSKRMDEALADALAAHDAAKINGTAACGRWGVGSLDRKLPIRPGKLYILAGQPGGGKTSLALQAVMATWGDFGPDSAAIISREMSASELAAILAGAQMGISRDTLESGDLTESQRAELIAIQQDWTKRGGGPVVHDSGEKVTVNDVCTWVRQRHARSGGKLKVVVVDHAGLLDKTDNRQSDYDKVSEVSDRLKKLCNAMNIAVILLSQMNRASRNNMRGQDGSAGLMPEPAQGCLKSSGDLEEDADAVVALWDRTKPDYADATVTACIIKNRLGGRGHIDLVFHKADGQRFEEAAEAKRKGNVRMFTPPDEAENIF